MYSGKHLQVTGPNLEVNNHIQLQKCLAVEGVEYLTISVGCFLHFPKLILKLIHIFCKMCMWTDVQLKQK